MAPFKRGESSTLIRFLFVGGISSLAYSLIIAAAIRFIELPAFILSVVLFCLFIPVTFQAHKHHTFMEQNLRKGAFFRYAALQVACFTLISYLSSQRLNETHFLSTTLLYFLTVIAAALLSFIVGRYLIFRP